MIAEGVLSVGVWGELSLHCFFTTANSPVLSDDLGISPGATVMWITALGVVASIIGRWRDRGESARSLRLTTSEAIAIALAAAFLVADGRFGIAERRLTAIASELTAERDHVDALDLAE